MQYGCSTKPVQLWMAALFTTLTISTTATASQVTLVNGDIINGQLEEQTGEHLIWNSDSLGTLTIALEQVALIDGQPFGEKPTEIFSNTYYGSLSFTGAYASGNQEREDWDFDSRVEWRQGDFRHHSNLNYETHSLNDSPANREYALGYGVDWFFQEQWFWKNAFFYGANEERAIDRYYAIGSAIGRQFWESERSALSAESGLLWLSEDFEDQSSDRRLTWSWATNYRTRVLGNIELFHSNQLLIALTDLKDSDLRADLGLKVPVVENLFTELKLEWIFDNQPAAGTERSDSQLTIGVNYSW